MGVMEKGSGEERGKKYKAIVPPSSSRDVSQDL